MSTLTTRVNGIKVTATRTIDGWEAVIMPDTPVMARPFDLRSTYASADPATALYCATWDAATYDPDL